LGRTGISGRSSANNNSGLLLCTRRQLIERLVTRILREQDIQALRQGRLRNKALRVDAAQRVPQHIELTGIIADDGKPLVQAARGERSEERPSVAIC
jgi:hypothetical protein